MLATARLHCSKNTHSAQRTLLSFAIMSSIKTRACLQFDLNFLLAASVQAATSA